MEVEILRIDKKKMLEIIDKAMIVLSDFYVHLPQKTARYAFDPLMALKVLRNRINNEKTETETETRQFHKEMMQIFNHLKDGHTRYHVRGLNQWAELPFTIEKCYHLNKKQQYEEHYLVTHINPPNGDFAKGVEVTHWNGVPIKKAIELNAEGCCGSNRAAHLAQGLAFLTRRHLAVSDGPLEDWVTITYLVREEGETYESFWERIKGIKDAKDIPYKHKRYEWTQGNEPSTNSYWDDFIKSGDLRVGVDCMLDYVQRSQEQIAKSDKGLQSDQSPEPDQSEQVRTVFDDSFFKCSRIPYGNGVEHGCIRIFEFVRPSKKNDSTKKMNDEELRDFFENTILGELKGTNGLIVDIRGNPGGDIVAAELLLQVLTNRQVHPTRFQFRHSQMLQEMAKRNRPLNKWANSLREAGSYGAEYSQAFPLSPRSMLSATTKPANPNNKPVVLIVDALCYSAADMFAAGFKDSGIGQVIGIDARTGAGGAMLWSFDGLLERVNHLLDIELTDKDCKNLANENYRKTIDSKIKDALGKREKNTEELKILGPFPWCGAVGFIVEGARKREYIATFHSIIDEKRLAVTVCGDRKRLGKLPNEVEIRFAISRALRSGARKDIPLEDIGVGPTLRYRMNVNDILHGNASLYKCAADQLERQPRIKVKPGTIELNNTDKSGDVEVVFEHNGEVLTTKKLGAGRHRYPPKTDRIRVVMSKYVEEMSALEPQTLYFDLITDERTAPRGEFEGYA